MSSFMHFSHCHYDYLKVADSSESVISTDALISFHSHNIISVFESSSIRHHVNNNIILCGRMIAFLAYSYMNQNWLWDMHVYYLIMS